MLELVDNFLNKITMYRLVLYVLLGLALTAVLFSSFGLLPYNPVAVLFSVFFISAVCLITNIVFAKVFKVPANVESAYITALILALIITPFSSANSAVFLPLAFWASVLSMASKYIFAIGKKHIFNPAAISVAITAFAFGGSASWWVGTLYMLPFALLGGFLITRKIQRSDLVLSFIATMILVIAGSAVMNGSDVFSNVWRIMSATPLFFFATVMLTEPLTTPPTRSLRIIYGILTGFLFSPMMHIGSIYSTPELALVVGNIFSYLVSPKEKLILKLKKVRKVANNTYNFEFASNRKINFRPGQYLEWTVPDDGADSRGNRRYFTIASSPTEKDIIIGVKFYPKPSSFKKRLIALRPGEEIIASQRAGDFTLPKNKKKKLVFVAGGIGVTPFRSMIQYLLDKKEKRDIVIMYANNTADDVAYADVLDRARDELGIRTVYVLTDLQNIPASWKGRRGRINPEMVLEEIPDLDERTFYVSGSHSMVSGFENALKNIGVSDSRVKKDFFPGFA